MRFVTSISSAIDPKSALNELRLTLPNPSPNSIVFYYTDEYCPETLWQLMTSQFPHASLIGCSSSNGVMTDKGYFNQNAIALIAIYDEGISSYGAALSKFDDYSTIAEATEHAIHEALHNADREGEVPSLVVLHSTPGNEEEIIHTIDTIFGTRIPMIGGSAADDKIQGKWTIMTHSTWTNKGVSLQLLFPSKPLAAGISAGYSPTEFVGKITKATGRTLEEIDHEPAKEIYKEWVSDHSNIQISDEYIFEHVTRFPIGRKAGQFDNRPYYKLTHPMRITDSGGLELFAQVDEGEDVTLMTCSHEQLIHRAARVINEANAKNYSSSKKLGAISIFCAGAMLRLKDDMTQVHSQMVEQLEGAPFICPFTFGEQGRFAGGENAHGNLMISSVIFYDSE
ncbi:FIST signal transduction protein [Vibrio sp. RC27]